jgi:hypothetical protein
MLEADGAMLSPDWVLRTLGLKLVIELDGIRVWGFMPFRTLSILDPSVSPSSTLMSAAPACVNTTLFTVPEFFAAESTFSMDLTYGYQTSLSGW